MDRLEDFHAHVPERDSRTIGHPHIRRDREGREVWATREAPCVDQHPLSALETCISFVSIHQKLLTPPKPHTRHTASGFFAFVSAFARAVYVVNPLNNNSLPIYIIIVVDLK